MIMNARQREVSAQLKPHPQTNASPKLRPQTNASPKLRPQTNASPKLRPQTNASPKLRPQTNASPKPHPQIKFSDEKLYELCQRYGQQARLWRQKFAGLLPEVNRRRLYERKGFGSVFEFAKKLAGMTEDQVRLVLNLEKRFSDKPILKNLLENGEVSAYKLARVVSVATKENQLFLAAQAKFLPKSALDVLVRDEKAAGKITTEGNDSARGDNMLNGLFKPKNEAKSPPGQSREMQYPDGTAAELNLAGEVQEKLLELQQKGIDINEIILWALRIRELEIEWTKTAIASEMPAADGGRRQTESSYPEEMYGVHDNACPPLRGIGDEEMDEPGSEMEYSGQRKQADVRKSTSRYIPARIRKLLQKEHGTKCSLAGCVSKAKQIHHTQRFALSKNHDPRFLAPLCREHHVIAHTIDVKFQHARWGGFDGKDVRGV